MDTNSAKAGFKNDGFKSLCRTKYWMTQKKRNIQWTELMPKNYNKVGIYAYACIGEEISRNILHVDCPKQTQVCRSKFDI